MKSKLAFLILIVLSDTPLFAQQPGQNTTVPGLSEYILLKQVQDSIDQQNSNEYINERMKSTARLPVSTGDYLLGAGDVIEISVVGIPGLDKKLFTLDGKGNIYVPYIGQVELLGGSTRDAEAKLIKLFAVSVLEDPQVTVGVKEHRSQYYYVMGAVKQTGRYPLTQPIDILDALAAAGGITEKADTNIKIYRYAEQRRENASAVKRADGETPPGFTPGVPMEVSIARLLEAGQSANRMHILSGDVIEVQERKEKTYYVLGDIQKPGAFLMDSKRRMDLSHALANAGGMLKTAAGRNVLILRQKGGSELPEQIKVNAYSVLNGQTKDVELCENDIVLVPGSYSKTLGKNFLGGVTGLLGTLILLGAR